MLLSIYRKCFLVPLIVAFQCAFAAADFTNDEIYSTLQAPNIFPGDNLWDGDGGALVDEPTMAVVGDGIEYSWFITFADFGADTIEVGYDFPRPLDIGDDVIIQFTDLDGGGPISGLTVLDNDFTGVEFSFTEDSISIFIPDQGINNFPSVIFKVSFDSIPEPSGALVLLLSCNFFVVRFRS